MRAEGGQEDDGSLADAPAAAASKGTGGREGRRGGAGREEGGGKEKETVRMWEYRGIGGKLGLRRRKRGQERG